MMKGRKPKYETSFNTTVYDYMKENVWARRRDIAKLFGVNEMTVTNWRTKYPDFKKSMDDGKKEFWNF